MCGPCPVACTHPASRTAIQEGLVLSKLLWLWGAAFTPWHTGPAVGCEARTGTWPQLQGQQRSEVIWGRLSLPWLSHAIPKYRDVSGQAAMAIQTRTAQLAGAGHSTNAHSFSPELDGSRVLVCYRLGHPWQQVPRPRPGLRGMTMPACTAASPWDTGLARLCWAVLFQPLGLVQAGHPLRGLGHASLCGSVSPVHEAGQVLLGSTFPGTGSGSQLSLHGDISSVVGNPPQAESKVCDWL